MLQLRNGSPFAVEMFGLPDAKGIDTLYVVVKGSFQCTPSGLTLAAEQCPVTLTDQYWGEPGESSLRYPSEAHLDKPGTDVLVLGDACAPDQRPTECLDIGVSIAGRRCDARVYGDRYWTEGLGGLRPSGAKPFVRMPVVYERAFGGTDATDPEQEIYRAEPRNPVGRGFVGKRPTGELLGQPAPNIEDPRHPIGDPSARIVPVGFGPVAPSWQPRAGYGGTYDEAWRRTVAPHLPADFDPRFFNTAAAPLVFADNLVGGEPVVLRGFHPRGVQRWTLPSCELSIEVTVAGNVESIAARLETVLLEPTDERLTLSWRASFPADRTMLRVEQVAISLLGIDGVEPGG